MRFSLRFRKFWGDSQFDPMPQVHRGVVLLNQHKPGWRSRVNWERLSMASMYDCILGQLYGSYDYGLEALDLDAFEAGDHAFTVTGRAYPWELLDSSWKLWEMEQQIADVRRYRKVLEKTGILG